MKMIDVNGNVILPDRKWIDLTDDDLSLVINRIIGYNSCVGWEKDIAHAVVEAFKEKNK